MKNIYDYKHVKSVSAIALLYNGEYVGKIISNWSDNGICTTMVYVGDGPLKTTKKRTAKASGYGYCKFSQSIGELGIMWTRRASS